MNVPYLYVNFKYTKTCRDKVILFIQGWSPKPIFDFFIYYENTPPPTTHTPPSAYAKFNIVRYFKIQYCQYLLPKHLNF